VEVCDRTWAVDPGRGYLALMLAKSVVSSDVLLLVELCEDEEQSMSTEDEEQLSRCCRGEGDLELSASGDSIVDTSKGGLLTSVHSVVTVSVDVLLV